MKTTLQIISFVSVFLVQPMSVMAATYNFVPPDDDIWDLDHDYADLWGIDYQLQPGERIVDAWISFDNIRNWKDQSNDLFVSLMDDAPEGLSWARDNGATGNYWQGTSAFNTELVHYQDLPATPQDLRYSFTAPQIDLLTIAMGDGNFGLGFDADCHFYNDGISFTIETTSSEVPEPATMILFGTGLVGVAAVRRRKS